ncbi:DoxX family protein [uncultured Mucilaginibacter sp.]|uniref:DoxX family protein n=1 Tax=uncultured Mucilaginibacter sp. TaxID=797541 RepID=UPI0026237AB7|nr:DoxX family protein [uncultured Mucilaginibacter sp.]
MKKNKIIYWTATGIIGAMMLFSAFSYLTNQEMKAAFVHLGFPNYFRIELAIAKIIGVIVLLLPFIPKEIKDMAYVGFGITFISAFIAHTSSGDPILVAIMPLIFLGILVVSFTYSKKYLAIRNVSSNNPSKEIFSFK